MTPSVPAPRTESTVLALRAVSCTYRGADGPVVAVHPVDLDIQHGAFLAIMGPSGSGKSTLLHCAAGLQQPTGGEVRLDGTLLSALDDTGRAELRRSKLGFVFQQFGLLPALTAAENVELPIRLDGRRPERSRTVELLRSIGMGDRIDHRPDQLSGGQQQRVAIARALISAPRVVFADEPTGALDLRSARDVLRLLRSLADAGQTIVMVTHDPVAAAYSDQVLFLADGRIVDRLPKPSADAVASKMAGLVQAAERTSTAAPVGG